MKQVQCCASFIKLFYSNVISEYSVEFFRLSLKEQYDYKPLLVEDDMMIGGKTPFETREEFFLAACACINALVLAPALCPVKPKKKTLSQSFFLSSLNNMNTEYDAHASRAH